MNSNIYRVNYFDADGDLMTMKIDCSYKIRNKEELKEAIGENIKIVNYAKIGENRK